MWGSGLLGCANLNGIHTYIAAQCVQLLVGEGLEQLKLSLVDDYSLLCVQKKGTLIESDLARSKSLTAPPYSDRSVWQFY